MNGNDNDSTSSLCSSNTSSSSEEEESKSCNHFSTFNDEEVSVDWDQESSSHMNPANDDCFCSPFRILKLFSMCFWPSNSQSKQRENDCFVAVDRSQALYGRIDYSIHRSYTPTLERVEEHPVPPNVNIFTPLVEKLAFKRLFHRDMGTIHSPTSKYTPISTGSLASNMGFASNLGTTSSNTMHRRADLSAGFFTLETLEAIHSDNDTSTSSTPSNDSTNSEGRKADEIKLSVYQTPARPRVDSEIFRKNMGLVTCEKLANSDDDVSPIESEEEFRFSGLLNADKSAKSPFGGNEVHKRLVYEDAETNPRDSIASPFEIGKAIESFQAIFRFPAKVPAEVPQQPLVENKPPRQSWYFRQSISFIKALRRNGAVGKVLIQGWVAFRQKSWREVSLCTRRSDFRYIVLLDDMPTLHMFSSKPKQKRGQPKVNLLLDNCIQINLNEDVEVRISLASKELGHEVFLVDSESFICSMLPVAMKNQFFLDKHRARLARSDVLGEVFQKTKSSTNVTFQDEKAKNTSAAVEQNDAARHLLFVLSAAITFPPPR